MALIDADCCICPKQEDGIGVSAEELMRRMDDAGVDQAVVYPHPPYLRILDQANEYVRESVEQFGDRLFGFGMANPRLGQKSALETVGRCLDDYGLRGIMLNGAADKYNIDDEKLALPLIERVAEKRAILALHCGGDGYVETHPQRVDNIAKRFPELRIMCVRMGGVYNPGVVGSAVEMAEERENVLLVASAVKQSAGARAANRLAGRVAFGSYTPFRPMKVEWALTRAMIEETELPPEEAEAFLGAAVARWMGAGHDGAGAGTRTPGGEDRAI